MGFYIESTLWALLTPLYRIDVLTRNIDSSLYGHRQQEPDDGSCGALHITTPALLILIASYKKISPAVTTDPERSEFPLQGFTR